MPIDSPGQSEVAPVPQAGIESDRDKGAASTITVRILPPEEWPRLKGGELDSVWSLLSPDSTLVFVAELAGQIVGTWSLSAFWHAEGLWIHPDHRKRGVVGAKLLTAMRGQAATLGVTAVLTSSQSAEVTALLHRVKAQLLSDLAGGAIETFIWPLMEAS